MTLPLADIILLKSIRFIILNKCNSKELYSLQGSQNDTKTKSHISFEIFFPNKEIEWQWIYLMPRRVTIDTMLGIFQYNILNNVL